MYKYTRKECNKEIETIKRIFSGPQIMPGSWLETVAQYLHATQLMLLAQKEDKKGCKHDWSYDEPMYSTKRVCTKCGRTEFRQIYQVNGIENATNWNQCIQEVKQPIKSKDVKFEEIIELKSLRYQDSDAIKMFIKINELVRNQNKLIQEVNMLKAGK